MKLLALLFGLLGATSALACYVPPVEQRVSPKELIARSKNIVLAQAIKAEIVGDQEILYTFKKIRSLAGRQEATFTLRSYISPWEEPNTTFNHHSAPEFWEQGGRSPNDVDCKIHPSFSVGSKYLLFLDQPYHIKSFELIIRTDGDKKMQDKWLQFVEENVKP